VRAVCLLANVQSFEEGRKADCEVDLRDIEFQCLLEYFENTYALDRQPGPLNYEVLDWSLIAVLMNPRFRGRSSTRQCSH